MRIESRQYDHPDAVKLIDEVQQEYVIRYGGVDETPVDPAEFAPPLGLFLVGYLDDVPLVTGGWRRHDESSVEMKRLYVSPSARGKGLARAMLAELEIAAAEAGYRNLILETGSKQPEAIALYLSSGYTRITPFGFYADAPEAQHLGKDLARTLGAARAE
ncbi:GNAT family N-acetyltransferase [Actinokineospora sp. NBRC 105648]|uniref:GNAT family N-acetyltransferase n=1 Tax=Actinokineospora sp. NBRC 105648 TaxID=3032206 RepID=UPI0024A0BEC0|nr:GNAT family N-acetyltransferase [Actinokineospora sp. NBRC 105648]GLZ41719.1 N-acetyltransferase [Actinokineospora sp. NBRC 105648]